MTDTMNLDDALATLCDRYGLVSLGVTQHVHPTSDKRVSFGCSAQWMGANMRECVLGHGDTSAEAIGMALSEVEVRRRGSAPVPAMTLEVAA